jgi:K+-sensing histidine kinase KdpD
MTFYARVAAPASCPETCRANIFDPLTRTYSYPEKRGTAAGVGLGLYICRCIAQAHGGSIRVKSFDTTTVFTVECYPARLLEWWSDSGLPDQA